MVEIGTWSNMAPDEKLHFKPDKCKSSKDIIHSGQFMVSEIDDSEVQEEEQPSLLVLVDAENDDGPIMRETWPQSPEQQKMMKDYKEFSLQAQGDSNMESPSNSLTRDSSLPLSIDENLTKLFKCMSLIYSGGLTSPRWQNFRGIKFRLKEKIRLNNIVWRAWHLQFIARRDPLVCRFASPVDSDVHTRPQAIIMEGKYWKRKIKTIKAEYKKWRMFYKERLQRQTCRNSPIMDWDSRWPWPQSNSSCGDMDDDFMMDFSADTLFNSLIPNQPFDFPNPREIAKAGIADFIQPGLVQLQPPFEDCMDTFDPFQAYLTPKLPPLPEETTVVSGMGFESSTTFKQKTYQTQSSESEAIQVDSSVKPETALPAPDSSQLEYPDNSQGYAELFNSLMKTALEKPSDSSSTDVSALPQDCSSMSDVGSNSLALSMCVSNSLISAPSPLTTTSMDTNQTTLKTVLNQPQQNLNVNESQVDTFCGYQEAAASTPPARSTRTRRTNVISRKYRLPPMQQSSFQASTLQGMPSSLCTSSQMPQNSQQELNNLFNAPLSTESFSGSYLSIAPRKQSLPSQTPHDVSSNTELSSFPLPVHLASTVCSTDPVTTQSQIQVSNMQSSSLMALKLDAALQELCNTSGPTAKRTTSREVTEERTYRRNSHTGYFYTSSRQRGTSPTSACYPPSSDLTNTFVSENQFAMPKAPVKQRVRSRSVSSPQIGSPKLQSQQPSQAVSLTNISISPPPMLTVPNVTATVATSQTAVTAAAVLACTSPVLTATPLGSTSTATTVLQQNAVLAQLLSSSNSFVSGTSTTNIVPVTSTTTISTTSAPTVTIISSVPAVTQTVPQTFVISPVTLATVPGMSDFQRPLIVGTASSVFSTNGTAKVPLPMTGQVTASGPVTGGSPTPVGSHLNDSAGSLSKPFKPKSDEERVQYKEHRRVSHINAEQKRRCNIKNGFDALKHLLPSLSQNPNAKVSKAAMLQKAADYIRTLKTDRQQQQEEVEVLKKQIDDLNQVISVYQNQLPATGAPVMCQRSNHMKELFTEYVRVRTLQNWKFWIFSLIIEPLLESYSNSTVTSNIEDFCKAVATWLEQHCSLAALRPSALNSLRQLSTTTNILTDPSRLPEEATWAVTKKENSRQ